ncbi:hypothetical protein JG486_30605 (plasmid) [Bacillus mycoides]|nr:hypothetical protein JG486_30605 [Bacillus mycoides]
MKNNINVYIGVIASICIFVLSIIFLYFNPYDSSVVNKEAVITVFFMLLLPSCFAVVAILIKKNIAMIICNIWLLPGTLYLGVSTIPSVWNLYILFLFIYFLSVMRLKNK